MLSDVTRHAIETEARLNKKPFIQALSSTLSPQRLASSCLEIHGKRLAFGLYAWFLGFVMEIWVDFQPHGRWPVQEPLLPKSDEGQLLKYDADQ
ncbi:hypothetical protein D9758_006922 [Tetrapyrgos nigripes]|uniref:Uncharacterized protein n=1 Tax=Tetrapyrgos nigripes TaxID=182062 RepID=A0A8H5GS94_9AGAR|nr:hypothetical protein D9758_006922 [Tetrapyrgos nigripes]